jgi:dTDP-glucose pyrophosphorylase
VKTNVSLQRAVLLAAGRGKRLGTLTADRPKPMVPVCDKPVLEHILLGMRAAGLTDFLFVVGYRAEIVAAHFSDGARWNVRITYTYQEVPKGTGAALAHGRDFAGNAPILVSYADILTDPAHYREMAVDYASAPCAALIGINPVDDPAAGAAVYREGNRVVQVVEKPPPGTAQSAWNVAGVSVYSPSIWPALENLKPSPRGELELTDALSALIASGEEVRAYEMRGFWSDVGTPEALAEAEQRTAIGAHHTAAPMPSA